MNILITGASGFIASQIVTDLLHAGHAVTCCVRNVRYTKNLFPQTTIIPCDFINDTNPQVWVERLKNIDVVINCVGILYHPNKKIIWAIHYDTPKALFAACVQTGVQKILQISALGVDKSNVEYAKSKKAAEDYLLGLSIPSIIFRPSLVYGRGSYGGTSLFRGLAGLPWILPVPGTGSQEFQPIYLPDLSKAMVYLVGKPIKSSMILSAVSAKRITLKEILMTMRSWLGFSKAIVLHVPLVFIRLASWFGDLIPYSALNNTSYKMLSQNNITNETETKKFHEVIEFVPSDFKAGIFSQPSSVQDHWHARLFFLKPLLLFSIAFVWIFSGVCSLFLYPQKSAFVLLSQVGIKDFWQPVILYASSILDIVLGIALLVGYRRRSVAVLQIIVIIIYTIIITGGFPRLWLEPFAAFAKNIPLIVATLVYLALESDR